MYNLGMGEMTRKLRRVGGSIMLPLPPEILQDAGLSEGDSVLIRSSPGHVRIEAEAAPDSDAMEFMDAFLGEYREAMAKLAQR
jgi:antitoxin component of MazEF toxin-antitoxin module